MTLPSVPSASALARRTASLACALVLGLAALAPAQDAPLDDRFRYQGELRNAGVIVDGTVDFQLTLFDQPVGGNAIGSTVTMLAVPVTRGVFELDVAFAAGAFAGAKRHVQVAVRSPAGAGAYTTLSPRVELLPSPNAHFARRAADADAVGGTPLANLVQKGEAGAVTAGMIASHSITAADIVAGTITGTEIAANTINSSDIQNNAVTSVDIADGGVASVDILDGTIALADLAANSVDGSKIVDGSIGAADLAPGALSGLNATTLDGIDSTSFLRSDVVDTIASTEWTIQTGLTPNAFTIGGANVVLQLGDSTADSTSVVGFFHAQDDVRLGTFSTDSTIVEGTLSVGGDTTFDQDVDIQGSTAVLGDFHVGGFATLSNALEMGATDGDQTISFWDGGVASGAYLKWDDMSGLTCAPFGTIDSNFRWFIADAVNSGWVFGDGSDYEVFIDETGNIVADGAVTASSGCDLAEMFFAPAELPVGTVVALVPGTSEHVEPSRRPFQPALVGVVSSAPGLVLDGPSYDTLPMVRQHRALDALLVERPDDEDLAREFVDLELQLDSAPRGNVPVALAGRVPVRVVGRVAAGDPLTSSHVPGCAMALDRPGPALGIALQDKFNEAEGDVLMLVQPGYQVPQASSVDEPLALPVTFAAPAVEERIARLEQLVLRDGRDGASALDARDGRDGAAGRDGLAHDGDALATDGVQIAAPTRAAFAKEAWGDFDADGRDDVFVVSPGAASTLFRNLGDGRFADVGEGAGLGELSGVRLAAWEDVDGDRRLDLLLVDRDGVARLLQGNGGGRFVDVTAALGLDFGQPVTSAEWIDHDHDGRPDLRVTLGDGRLVLHHNLGGGAFRAVELASGAGVGDADRVAQLEARLAELQATLEALVAAQGGAR